MGGAGAGRTRARFALRGAALAPLSARTTKPHPLGAFCLAKGSKIEAPRSGALLTGAIWSAPRANGALAVARQTRSRGYASKRNHGWRNDSSSFPPSTLGAGGRARDRTINVYTRRAFIGHEFSRSQSCTGGGICGRIRTPKYIYALRTRYKCIWNNSRDLAPTRTGRASVCYPSPSISAPRMPACSTRNTETASVLYLSLSLIHSLTHSLTHSLSLSFSLSLSVGGGAYRPNTSERKEEKAAPESYLSATLGGVRAANESVTMAKGWLSTLCSDQSRTETTVVRRGGGGGSGGGGLPIEVWVSETEKQSGGGGFDSIRYDSIRSDIASWL